MEVGLGTNEDKTRYMLMSGNQIASQNSDIRIANILFGNNSNKSNMMQEEIKKIYHSVQNLLSSCLLLESVKTAM
jgi:hypothetical protein